jgi:hypothetical protein
MLIERTPNYDPIVEELHDDMIDALMEADSAVIRRVERDDADNIRIVAYSQGRRFIIRLMEEV